MKRSDTVFTEVSTLYAAATTPMGTWMWQNHVQWVADKAKKLAEKYGANAEMAYCAALLHDFADCQYERGHDDFNNWSEAKGKEVLLKAGFDQQEAKEIIEIIIRPHSCRPGNLPTTIEGKVLATADAMFHVQTNFFPILCYMHRPEHTATYEEWQQWFTEKIARDYGPKIFFEDERSEIKEDYEALVKVFGNNSLHSQAV